MANYIGFTRSNYFRVTDPDALKKIIKAIMVDGEKMELWELTENGTTYYGFGAYGSISGLRYASGNDNHGDEFEADAVYEALGKVVAPDDAIIITEIGYEKLRYLTAYAVIITRTEVEFVELRSDALDTAQRMLRNPEYNPRMDY